MISLRARKLVITNPTFRIHIRATAMAVPPAADPTAIREALDSASPARAVITALLAYHAIHMRQLARHPDPIQHLRALSSACDDD